jgi:diguanylate cyclase (GGDEF)-like protein/PAS domain S-box-containing protein
MAKDAMTKSRNTAENDLELFRDLINKSNDAIFVADSETGLFIFVNDKACASLRYERQELLKMGVMDIETTLPDNFLWQTHVNELRQKGSLIFEGMHKRKNGGTFPIEANISHVVLNTREYLVTVVRDITERKRAETALRESEERYKALFDRSLDCVFLTDFEGRFLDANQTVLDLLGYKREDISTQTFASMLTADQLPLAFRTVEEIRATGRQKMPTEFQVRCKDGKHVFLETQSSLIYRGGKPFAVQGIARDVTERKKMEEQLRSAAFFDDLTGLYNRRGFFTFAEEFLKLAKRRRQGLFMLYTDLDNLKLINDTLGHEEGDQALIDSANVIKETYRESDIVARIGGDEFAVIPIGTTGDNIEQLTGRLLNNIENYNLTKKRDYSLSMSFGTSYYDPAAPCSVNQLIAYADKMMYEQKRLKKEA